MLDQGTKTIDWDDFRFVLAIVRGGSVSAAAKQLAVDHATVIRRVDRLERHLSAKLFDRRKTGYLLTEAGQRVADSAEAMESTIVANQEAVGGSRAQLTGTVRIGAPDGFGSHFLASRLVKFTERYPDLDLQLVATARLFSLSKREADIAISLTMPKEGRIVGRKLLDYSLGLYAAPAYLDRAPKIVSRGDLPGHRFVGYIEELLFTPELDYLPQVSPKISAKFRSANLIAQLNATIAGFGIAVLPHFMATAHPELRPVLPDEVRISRTFWMLMHADSKDLARIRAVADYILETVESERALFGGHWPACLTPGVTRRDPPASSQMRVVPGSSPSFQATGDGVVVRTHCHMLGGSMDVANRALQRASFENGRGAGVGGDRIDDPDAVSAALAQAARKKARACKRRSPPRSVATMSSAMASTKYARAARSIVSARPRCPEPAHGHASAWCCPAAPSCRRAR